MHPLAMTIVLVVGLSVFAWTARGRWRLMFAASAPEARGDRRGARLRGVMRYMFGQERMFRYEAAGVAHAFIFGGFVVLGLRTLVLVARGYSGNPGFGFWLFDEGTPLGALYTFLKDLVGVLVIAGVLYFLYQRMVVKLSRIELSVEGVLILCMILGIIASDLSYEAGGFVRHDTPAGERMVAPAAALLSIALGAGGPAVADNFYILGFWMHTLLVLTFLNLLPYGKHFHVLTVLPNVYCRQLDGIGRLAPIDDMEGRLERGETLGVKTARDLSWKDVLDFYTCTECGRCSDHCPAFNTGKLLSPKHLTMQMREHMYANARALLENAAPPAAGAQVAASGTSDASAAVPFVTHDGETDESHGQLVPAWVDAEMIWGCTTCGACEQECPVFISYVDKIVDVRRNLVLERGEFPEQLQNAFRGLETAGNPYSFDNSQRAEWAEGLDVPLLSDKPDAEYLFWVGCAPAFDDRSRKIARATATLFKQAGVSFAILGPEESCNGDPARRAGNEYLFQMLANQNVETLNNYKVRRIVTTCPHCFNMLANEYSAFGGKFEVIHHTQLLADLVRSGRLTPKHHVAGSIVFHDSCYLGRYNEVYDPPREILRAIPGLELHEAAESRDRGMCCGAGGAQMWKEEEAVRRPNSREGDGKVNHARARQLLRVLPNGAGSGCKVATACPFCKTMLSDGLTDLGHEHVEQRDVAEFLLQSIQGS